MNEQGVRKFLLAVGVDPKDMVSARGWINCPCILAPYTHGAGRDEHPSFGVSIGEGRSVYYCFGCSPKAQLLEGLLHNIFIMSGEYPWEAAKIFIHEENWGEEDGPLPVPDRWLDFKGAIDPLPMEIISLFPLIQWRKNTSTASACKEYLDGRGVPEWVQNMYGVRIDLKRSCLVFSLTDPSGRIFMLRERSIKEKKMWTVSPDIAAESMGFKIKEYVGFKAEESSLSIDSKNIEFPKLRDVGAWFGMHLINWSKPVMLVEGEIKVMRLAALGFFNAIGSATSSVSEAQIDAVSSPVTYMGYDADKAGALAHHRITERIKDRTVLYELDWSLVGRKDPDELKNKGELERVLKNARPI